MTGKEKKMFNDRFNIFIDKLTKLFNLKILTPAEVTEIEAGKNPSTNKHSINKNYYYSLLYERYDKLLSLGLDTGEALLFIFEPLNQILTIQRMSKWRKPKVDVKPYLDTIKYRIKNRCSEYKACDVIAEKIGTDTVRFKNAFRKWYKEPNNRLRHPEIYLYLEYLAGMKQNK